MILKYTTRGCSCHSRLCLLGVPGLPRTLVPGVPLLSRCTGDSPLVGTAPVAARFDGPNLTERIGHASPQPWVDLLISGTGGNDRWQDRVVAVIEQLEEFFLCPRGRAFCT